MSEPPGEHELQPVGYDLDYRTFRRLTFYGVLGGLCPLVPVPFLDDWLLGRVRGWMMAELGPEREPGLSAESVAVLAGRRDSAGWPGCAAGCLWALRKVAVKLLVKLFRKVLYFLAVRDGIHAATRLVYEGYLTLGALERDALGARRGDREVAARRLREAVLETLEAADLRPVRRAVGRIFRGSLALLVRAARTLGRPFLSRRARREADRWDPGRGGAREQATTAGETLEREEEMLGALVDRLASAMWGNREHLRRLAWDLDRRLGAGGAGETEGWTQEPPIT